MKISRILLKGILMKAGFAVAGAGISLLFTRLLKKGKKAEKKVEKKIKAKPAMESAKKAVAKPRKKKAAIPALNA
jgi:hypothetical protein